MKLPSLEVARGVAATLVILHHVSQHLAQELGAVPFAHALEPGHAAVDFFFVLSGFLMVHVSRGRFGRAREVPRFVVRRFLRIFPTYWVAFACYVALHAVSAHPPVSLGPASLLNDLVLWPRPPGEDTVVGVSWSLSFELAFYLLFAAFLVRRRLGALVLAAWMGATVAHTIGWIGPYRSGALELLTSSYNLLFPLGMGAALLLDRVDARAARVLLVGGGSVLVVGWVLEAAGRLGGYGQLARLVYGLGSALVVAGLAARDRDRGTAPPAAALALGEASYSIYLFHHVGIAFAAKALSLGGLYGRVPSAVLAAVMAGAGLVAGLGFGLTVERALVRWTRRLGARRAPGERTVELTPRGSAPRVGGPVRLEPRARRRTGV